MFAEGNEVSHRISCAEPFHIGETGFGTGLNLLATLKSLRENNIYGWNLHYFSVEKYPLSPERIAELIGEYSPELQPEYPFFLDIWGTLFPQLTQEWNHFSLHSENGTIHISLFIGDAYDFLRSFSEKMDVWFLDGHDPAKNTDMWTPELFAQIANHCKKAATLTSFSSAGCVKRGLREAGFQVKRRKGFGKKHHMVSCHI